MPAALCEQRSDPARTAALVELYTSQGCSSCPPADRWLATLPRDGLLQVPLSLHVDYWDHIGWRDPHARPAFTLRQRWTAERNGTRTIYTPGVFADGVEWRDWHRAGERRIRAINQRAPQADLTVAVAGKQVRVTAAARAPRTAGAQSAPALFVALTGSGLANAVTAGENRGERLVHDHVALQWFGPIETDAEGRATLVAALPPDVLAASTRPGVVAFVQDLATGRVQQAMRMDLAGCRQGLAERLQ